MKFYYLSLLLLISCTMAKLDPYAATIKVVNQVDSRCLPLGLATGKGGGILGGVFLSDEDLLNYANNALLNDAASKKATHIIPLSPSPGVTGFFLLGTSTYTQQGVIYQCPQ